MAEPTLRRAAPRYALAGLGLMLTCILTVPFWQESLLARLYLRTPDARRLAELSLDMDRLNHQVDDLQARLRETTVATDSARAEAATATRIAQSANERLRTLALIQLSAAMRHSGRFETELAMVWAVGGPMDGQAPLEKVRAYAGFGIPGLPQLRREFAALTATTSGGGGAGHMAWVAGLLGQGRQASVADDATRMLVGRVDNLLAEADLLGAVALARQIPDPAQGGLADWLDDAAAREAADALARHVATLASQAAGAPQ